MNENELAGATQPPIVPEPDRVREIYPIMFEKDNMDFTPQPVDAEFVDPAPKASSAPVYADSPALVTGLEDVSDESEESPVLLNVEKDILEGTLPGSGSQISSAVN